MNNIEKLKSQGEKNTIKIDAIKRNNQLNGKQIDQILKLLGLQDYVEHLEMVFIIENGLYNLVQLLKEDNNNITIILEESESQIVNQSQ